MISFMISVVPPKIDWTRLSRQSPAVASEGSSLVLRRSKPGSICPKCGADLLPGTGRVEQYEWRMRRPRGDGNAAAAAEPAVEQGSGPG